MRGTTLAIVAWLGAGVAAVLTYVSGLASAPGLLLGYAIALVAAPIAMRLGAFARPTKMGLAWLSTAVLATSLALTATRVAPLVASMGLTAGALVLAGQGRALLESERASDGANAGTRGLLLAGLGLAGLGLLTLGAGGADPGTTSAAILFGGAATYGLVSRAGAGFWRYAGLAAAGLSLYGLFAVIGVPMPQVALPTWGLSLVAHGAMVLGFADLTAASVPATGE